MANWYAQQSSVNINVANMWNASPVGTAGWLTWGNQSAGDVLVCNNRASIAINVDPAVGSTGIITNCASGGTQGGGFTYAMTAGLTINCSLTAGNAALISMSGASGSLTINGNVSGGDYNYLGVPIQMSCTGGTLTVNGNVAPYGGGGIINGASATAVIIVINGNVTASANSGNNLPAIKSNGAQVTINGNATASAYGNAVLEVQSGASCIINNGLVKGAAAFTVLNHAGQTGNVFTLNGCSIDITLGQIADSGLVSMNFKANNYIKYKGTNGKSITQYFQRDSISAGARNRTRSRIGAVT